MVRFSKSRISNVALEALELLVFPAATKTLLIFSGPGVGAVVDSVHSVVVSIVGSVGSGVGSSEFGPFSVLAKIMEIVAPRATRTTSVIMPTHKNRLDLSLSKAFRLGPFLAFKSSFARFGVETEEVGIFLLVFLLAFSISIAFSGINVFKCTSF